MLALGILSFPAIFVLIPLGIVAWILGSRDLRSMKRGEVDPAGRSLTQIGWVFGIASSVVWLGALGCGMLLLGGYRISESSADATGTARTIRRGFAQGPFHSDAPKNVFEFEFDERIQSDGEWLKDGHFVRRSRTGATIEEGFFRVGKREGEWTFRNEDGSVDPDRSGIYENDVRVQSGATPPGDYHDHPYR